MFGMNGFHLSASGAIQGIMALLLSIAHLLPWWDQAFTSYFAWNINGLCWCFQV